MNLYKRLMTSSVCLILLLIVFTFNSFSEVEKETIINGNSVNCSYTINKDKIFIDAERFFAYFGGSYKYDPKLKTFRVEYNGKTVIYSLSNKTMKLNSSKPVLSVIPMKINGLWYVPVEEMSKAINIKYTFNKNTNTLNIYDIQKQYDTSRMTKYLECAVSIKAYNSKNEFVKTGSGFYIESNGDVATSFDMIEDAVRVEIINSQGKVYDYSFVKTYSRNENYAVLATNNSVKTPLVEIGSINSIQAGDKVVLFDLSKGLQDSISEGVVDINNLHNNNSLFQINVPIESDIQGVALFNKFGKVIGMAISQNENNQNIIICTSLTDLLIDYTNYPIKISLKMLYDESHTIKYKDGRNYFGEIKNNNPNGIGTLKYANGDQYIGEFVDGKQHGKGKYIWANGDSLEGVYNSGYVNGEGTYIWNDGTKYNGGFKNDIINGAGEKFYASGDYEKGMYINGVLNGFCEIKTSVGTYIGEVSNGKFNGEGKLYDSNGKLLFNGMFVNGASIDSTNKLVNQTTSNSKNSVTSGYDTSQTASDSISGTISYPLKLYSDESKRVYLGKLTSNEYDSESIFNKYGTYGSEYALKSIWNEYGTYGSSYSSYSAFNKYAFNPPIIVDNKGNIVGRLTVNEFAVGAIDPYTLKSFLKSLGQ